MGSTPIKAIGAAANPPLRTAPSWYSCAGVWIKDNDSAGRW
jgi:hypothetical protein